MCQDMEREPTQSEVAKSLGYDDEEINSIMRAYRTHLSLDTPLKNDDQHPLSRSLRKSRPHTL